MRFDTTDQIFSHPGGFLGGFMKRPYGIHIEGLQAAFRFPKYLFAEMEREWNDGVQDETAIAILLRDYFEPWWKKRRFDGADRVKIIQMMSREALRLAFRSDPKDRYKFYLRSMGFPSD